MPSAHIPTNSVSKQFHSHWYKLSPFRQKTPQFLMYNIHIFNTKSFPYKPWQANALWCCLALQHPHLLGAERAQLDTRHRCQVFFPHNSPRLSPSGLRGQVPSGGQAQAQPWPYLSVTSNQFQIKFCSLLIVLKYTTFFRIHSWNLCLLCGGKNSNADICC